MYRQHYEFIDQTLKTESVMDMYDMYQACLSGAVALEEGGDRDTTEGQQIDKIRFTQDTHKEQHSFEDLLLGEIDVTYRKVSEPTSTPVLIRKTDTRIGEERSCNVDMIVLDVDGAQIPVVTDFENNCLKSFFTTNGTAGHSKLSLESGPWGITKLSERQVLVAVPVSKKIVTIDVSPKLRLISTVSTGKEYRGIAVLNKTSMAANSWFPNNSVDILDMSGQVMKVIVNDKKLLANPWSISVTSKGNILVSGSLVINVTCLTSEGNVVWTHITEGRPRGIAILGTGSVMFVDDVSKKVIQMTETGKFSRNVLTSDNGLKDPHGIYYDGKGSLFVSDGNHLYEFSFEN